MCGHADRAAIPEPISGDGYNLYWHLPIDDTHHWRYDIVFRRSTPMEAKDIRRNQEILDQRRPSYRPKRNKANRYLQDREAMKSWSFSGMGSAPALGARRAVPFARSELLYGVQAKELHRVAGEDF